VVCAREERIEERTQRAGGWSEKSVGGHGRKKGGKGWLGDVVTECSDGFAGFRWTCTIERSSILSEKIVTIDGDQSACHMKFPIQLQAVFEPRSIVTPINIICPCSLAVVIVNMFQFSSSSQ
jgi:hypothetical protein